MVGSDRRCGTCSLWGVNVYPAPLQDNTCCADIVMDLPASFKPERQTMDAHEGVDCPVWKAIEIEEAA